ncbi:MAG: Sua5/YciO/YrdC/YwlC family protein [Verrucomicrobiota bacterium]
MENSESSNLLRWGGNIEERLGSEVISREGGVIVSPTKVGYIIMTTDRKGLERKFRVKNRKRNKPGVVLCSSIEQLEELAELNPQIQKLYTTCWEKDILLGCILPWRGDSIDRYVPEGSKALMMDARQTSCFVVRFGVPSENVCRMLWDDGRKLVFASSANPSGQGNRGVISGIGSAIEEGVDLRIEADDYVRGIQPEATLETRYEQGVMVSMVDRTGQLVPEQPEDTRLEENCPVLIRKGLDCERIQMLLSDNFNSWNYRHGDYY